MSVDWDVCKSCGESICDAGDNWNRCPNCERLICSDCLVKPWEEDKETGEMSKDCCPFCSGTEIHNDDLLDFLLNHYGLSRTEAEKLYRESD